MSNALRQDKHSTTNSISFSSTTSAGSLLILVVVGTNDGSGSSPGGGVSISSPVTSGFSWTVANSASWLANQGSSPHFVWESGEIAVFYIQNASSMSSSTSTTVTVTGGSPGVDLRLYEFTGVAASSAIDTSANNNDSSTSATAVTAGNLTTHDTDLIFCATNTSPSSVSGYTAGVVAGDQYILNEAAGTVSTSYGISAALWGFVAVAFKTGSASATATGVSGSFSTGTASTTASSEASPSGLTGTFSEGTALPGGANQFAQPNGGVSATFGLADIIAGFPINYGNVVSGSDGLPSGVNTTYFYARWTGWLTVDTPGLYTLGLNCQDGADLYINSQPLVNALAASQTANAALAYTNSSKIYLAPNILYQIVLEWQHGTGADYQLQLLWTKPGDTAPSLITASALDFTGKWWNGNSSSWFPQTWY